jgi:hypothetical protein
MNLVKNPCELSRESEASILKSMPSEAARIALLALAVMMSSAPASKA